MITRELGLFITCLMVLASAPAGAASNDEIQVYDDAINKPGEQGLDWHMNHVINGLKAPQWPGDAPSNGSTRLTPEYSYGMSATWEFGAYLPLLMTQDGTQYVEGAKVRLKYIAPSDENESCYWGINQELGRVSRRSSDQYWGLEIRPIWGCRSGRWHFTVNPILDFSGDHLHLGRPDFVPAWRLSYRLKQDTSLGLEHYSDFGQIDAGSPYRQYPQNTYVVVDTRAGGIFVHFGVGKGWNASSDKWTVKAIAGTRF
jgi:hypothetical protein